MSKMRNSFIIRFLTLIFLLLFLSACGNQTMKGETGKTTVPDNVVIVTTFYPIYIEAANVTKNIPGIKLINLAPPTAGCLHNYQLNPEDLKKLDEADILVINGAGMEDFMDKIISQLPKLKIIDASKDIHLIKNQDGTYNPHVWVSITNAIKQVENIGEQLAILDPIRADRYAANTEAYTTKLANLRFRMHQAIDNVDRRDVIVFHDAFPYFAREFKLNIISVIESEPGAEPSAAELSETIRIAKETGTRVIFTEPQYQARSAETVARETGAKLYTFDTAVTGKLETDAYLNIMEKNMDILGDALYQNE